MKKWNRIKGNITAPKGFSAAGVSAGIKKSGKKDLALIYSHLPALGVGVFTKNLVKAAPLLLDISHLEQNQNGVRAIVVNSGNANACVGEQGKLDALEMAVQTAKGLGLTAEEILVASTGVIGVPLPMDKVVGGIKNAVEHLSSTGGDDAAVAIMTTDLTVKEIAINLEIGGKEIKIGAIAKGSGMIHPNMATMLCFITTDGAVAEKALQETLKEAVDGSFNMLTVDGDTSTNDMVLILANGAAENDLLTIDHPDYGVFTEAVTEICIYLAREIARDGEGATKLLEVLVKGGSSVIEARTVAKSVASSNLVKTALFGEDPNWGRILCAAGYSGAQFKPELVNIYLKSRAGEIQVASLGEGISFDEKLAKGILKEEEIMIILDLQEGEETGLAFGCDFSYDYVKINADYRT